MSYPNVDDLMEKGEAVTNADGNVDDLKNNGNVPASPNSTTTSSGILKADTTSEIERKVKNRQFVSRFKSKLTNLIISFSQKGSSVIPGRRSLVRALEDCPEGYPRLAAFLDSDENFMLYRRFGYLQARVLLYKQDELRAMEKQLDHLDQIDAENRPRKLRSRERDDAENQDRRNLIIKISNLWKEYAELLKTARELASFNRPPSRDYESVTSHFNHTDPICNPESYIYHKEDIVTLKPGRETAWLDAAVEKILQKLHCSSIQDLRRKASTDIVILYSRERINYVVSLIIILMILALLIVPVYLLWHLTRPTDMSSTATAVNIGVLLVSTLVFSGVLSLFTRAKRHEILAAAAGYCAVLVVFLGNIGQLAPL